MWRNPAGRYPRQPPHSHFQIKKRSEIKSCPALQRIARAPSLSIAPFLLARPSTSCTTSASPGRQGPKTPPLRHFLLVHPVSCAIIAYKLLSHTGLPWAQTPWASFHHLKLAALVPASRPIFHFAVCLPVCLSCPAIQPGHPAHLIESISPATPL